MGVARKNAKAGFKSRVAKTMQTETESAGCPRAGFRRGIQVQVPFDHLGESAKTLLGAVKILGAQSFLRSVNPAGARCAQQRVLNIDCHDQSGQCRLRDGWTNPLKRGQAAPLFNRLFVFIQKSPAKRASVAKTAVIAGAASD